MSKKRNSKGKEVRQLRKSLGMTQIELANYLGIKQATVSRFETGDREPSLPVCKLLDLLRREGVKAA